MLKVYADKYIQLGGKLADAQAAFDRVTFGVTVDGEDIGPDPEELRKKDTEALEAALGEVKEVCVGLGLSISAEMLEPHFNLPQTSGEFDILIRLVVTELKDRLFLYIPPHAAKFYEWDEIVSDRVKRAFEGASAEIRYAGTSFAAGLYTASVFHSMRAAEIGVRWLAGSLKIEFMHPIELTEWGVIQDNIDAKIKEFKQLPRSTKRDEDQRFYSEAAAQLRYFKDGWRIRVSHARETFTEQQAITVIEHVREFFEALANRLPE